MRRRRAGQVHIRFRQSRRARQKCYSLVEKLSRKGGRQLKTTGRQLRRPPSPILALALLQVQEPALGNVVLIAFGLLTWNFTRGLIETHRDTAMLRARLFIFLLAGFCLTVATGSSVPRSSMGQFTANGAAGVQPVLRLEKNRYVLGEAIRFWVGVMPKNSKVIPEVLRKPCSLIITEPDGTHRVDSVGWPTDGMPDRGWSGGWGFGEENVKAGHYILLLECVGERTPPVELIVERSEILEQIKAEFRFEREGVVMRAAQVAVVLTVQNNSDATIRFPQRGAMMEGVSLRIVRKEPAFHSDLFFPWEKLTKSTVIPDTYTWDVASEVPSVVLQPGEHFEQRFLLEDACSCDQAGDYEIGFTTVLSVLVGEKNSQYADMCPIRFPVTASAKFVLGSSDQF